MAFCAAMFNMACDVNCFFFASLSFAKREAAALPQPVA